MNLMKLTKPLATLGLGTLLAFSFSTTASAFTNQYGTATITWPGYDTSFVSGSTPVPNAEPVVVQVDFAQPNDSIPMPYLQFPGLPNPSYWVGQNDAFLTAAGECIDPPTQTLIATLITVPAIDYTLYKCYFFDGTSEDVGFGFYRAGFTTTGILITSINVEFEPGSVVQVSNETLAYGVDAGGPIGFNNFPMLTPAIEPGPTPPPNPGPQPSEELAKTGGSTDALLWASSVSAAAVAAGVAMTLTRRRSQTRP
jgi:hypothetical protein